MSKVRDTARGDYRFLIQSKAWNNFVGDLKSGFLPFVGENIVDPSCPNHLSSHSPVLSNSIYPTKRFEHGRSESHTSLLAKGSIKGFIIYLEKLARQTTVRFSIRLPVATDQLTLTY